MRTLVIGDIHGGLKGLDQCLKRCNFSPSNDQLIFLGDYVDGWSDSAKLIQELIFIKSTSRHEPIFLRGNHDKWCEDWLLKGKIHPYWGPNGGAGTTKSYIDGGFLTKQSHKEFFKNLKNYYIDNKNRAFLHAGFISRKGVGHEPYEATYYWDRDMWELALILHNQIDEQVSKKARRFEKHSEVFIGHTSTTNYKNKPHYPEFNIKEQPKQGNIIVPMNRCNVWNMDTGSGFDGKLTIMDIDTKEFWQSDFLTDLYPNEKGRN